MNLIAQIRHMAALGFVIPRIIAPSMVLILGILLCGVFFPNIPETLEIQKEKFLFGLLVVFLVMIFVIFPLAYFIARGNKTLVQNALHERLNSLSIIAESLERDIQNSRQEMNDLQKNRRLILEDAWRTKMRDMELTIAQKIQMGQSLIDSSSAKEKIKYQEHFLSLNHTLGLLKTIHSQMNQKIEAGLSDNVFEDLSRATQASFDAIIVAMENHILTLKNILEGIYLQRAKTTQALLQWNRR